MDVQLAFARETARHEEGILTTTGIGRNELSRDSKSLTVCGQIGFSLLDIGDHLIEVELEDPDGQIVWSESIAVEFGPPPDQGVA